MQNIYKLLFSICLVIFIVSETTAQCIEDSHSPFEDQGWFSCQERANPNNFRGPSHWLLYDLGFSYPIKSLYFWNHNVWGETGMGVKSMAVDYSFDKVTWVPLDTFEIEKAPGSWKYTGVPATEFDEVTAQYFLFTVIETWDGLGSCAGLGEIKFEIGEIVSDTEDPILAAGFDISPNPASDWLYINVEKDLAVDLIEIYSSMGQKLYSLNPQSTEDLKFDVQSLSPGMYYVSVMQEGKIATKSFVKME